MKDNDRARPSPLDISHRPFEEMIHRAIYADNQETAARMKRASAAAAILIAGRPGRALTAPEPLIQVGFEPDEHEMDALVAVAVARQRDLIHVSCHVDGVGGPTGMIATVYFEGGTARPHRRGGLLCAHGSADVFLSGVSDIEDETCHFILRPGRKMRRVAGYPVDDLGAGMQRAGERWIELSNSPALADSRGERHWVHGRKDSVIGADDG